MNSLFSPYYNQTFNSNEQRDLNFEIPSPFSDTNLYTRKVNQELVIRLNFRKNVCVDSLSNYNDAKLEMYNPKILLNVLEFTMKNKE